MTDDREKRVQTIAGTILPEEDDQVFYGVLTDRRITDVSSATLSAITSAAPLEWHAELKHAWNVLEGARERDLVLLTRDPGPIRSHITALTKQAPRLPDATLLAMADIVLKLRERRRERIWWIVGLTATAIAGPLITLFVQRLT